MPGMLLHIDGSKHRWFQDDRYYDLIVILDDATSRDLLRPVGGRGIDAHGDGGVARGDRAGRPVLCALQRPRAAISSSHRRPVSRSINHGLTQVGRALKELGVQMIPAYSPQARGRSERSFGTWQSRLPQELRLAGITTRRRSQPRSCVNATSTSSTSKLHGGSRRARHRLPPLRAQRSGLDLLHPNRTCGEQGQHRCHPGSMVATRQVPLAAYTGGPDGDHPPTSGWHRLDSLRPCTWWAVEKTASRGKPHTGFPPLALEIASGGFPLSHRRDDHESSLSQTKGEEGSMKPNRTTNVLIKPDNYKS